LTVRTVTWRGEQHVTVSWSEEHNWLVDHGGGVHHTDFDGAVDVDLAFSPLFNSLPIRRLGMHRNVGEHDLRVVFVSLPSLQVELVHQTYRTVSVGEQPVIAFSSGSFSAELTLDPEGLVLDYPGVARRL
ncbi:MAG: putative glycolipid-binding domain-containing protein, partial [Actinomycetota bacterium]|nr:putative glycolipid-binding domain-containing protein [Actinomycetota bacterium]